jgi:hypothetical protein
MLAASCEDATGREETGWAHDPRVDVLIGN